MESFVLIVMMLNVWQRRERMGATKFIKWPEIAQARGYEDPVKLVQDLYHRYSSLTKVADDLGVSTTPIKRILGRGKVEIDKTCRHCGGHFQYNPSRHNKMTCDSEACKELETARCKQLKKELTMKRRKAQADGDRVIKKGLYGSKKCPECKKPMEVHNRVRCNNCWRIRQSGGANLFEAYGVMA
jgi:hypothetical protein